MGVEVFLMGWMMRGSRGPMVTPVFVLALVGASAAVGGCADTVVSPKTSSEMGDGTSASTGTAAGTSASPKTAAGTSVSPTPASPSPSVTGVGCHGTPVFLTDGFPEVRGTARDAELWGLGIALE